MASPTVQQTTERPRAARAPVSPYRQLLRLTRTELTLFYRYRMALYIAVFPLVFVLIGVASEGEETLPGVDAAPYYITGTPALVAMAIGLWHISNVYAARREQLVLKRFRASGVTPFALFGASTLSVLAVVLLLTAVIGGVLAWRYGVWPADPAMVALPLVLTTVLMSLLGAAFTRLTRNAESAQLMAMFPFLILYGASGSWCRWR
ncbi:ABC transporter permease [Allosalinactinospora lopnorensis]|uniref:ABC transporter permease n=1 Tax=Allosalinactinospora lopnorensis TaxID=1352348 RepID=UPI0006962084|nr:ABC transporter permease [Allosalinactinospora lopnorensis]